MVWTVSMTVWRALGERKWSLQKRWLFPVVLERPVLLLLLYLLAALRRQIWSLCVGDDELE